jgi:RimJ/RimL family protein N-acetyltransferase
VIVATTERLILRRWQPSDREAFARMNADPRVMEFMPSLLCAVELRGEASFLGFVGLNVPRFEAAFTPCVEIAWRISAEYWGCGYATEGARAMVRYAFDTLQLDALVSFTVPANLRSRRVMEKIGMTHDPAEDFDHPNLASGHPLRRHVLYRLAR